MQDLRNQIKQRENNWEDRTYLGRMEKDSRCYCICSSEREENLPDLPDHRRKRQWKSADFQNDTYSLQPENENKTDHKSVPDFRHGEWGLCSICGFRQQ